MATSGTISQTSFTVLDVIENAFRMCRVSPQKVTAENLQTAKTQLYLLCNELVNIGVQLWTVESNALTMVAGTATITCPSGTIDAEHLLYKSASNNQETPLARISLDTYAMLPNKESQGRPTLYYVDRQLTPVLRLWPTPDSTAAADSLVLWRRRHIMDVGTYSDDLEVPQRWYPCMVAGLAYRLALFIETIDPSMMAATQPIWQDQLNKVMAEEGDKSPMMIAPDIGAYTA